MTMKNYLCEFNNKRKSLNKITFKTSVKHTYKDTKDNSHQSEILLRFPKKKYSENMDSENSKEFSYHAEKIECCN